MNRNGRPAARHAELGDFKAIAEPSRSSGGTRRQKKPRASAEPVELPHADLAAT